MRPFLTPIWCFCFACIIADVFYQGHNWINKFFNHDNLTLFISKFIESKNYLKSMHRTTTSMNKLSLASTWSVNSSRDSTKVNRPLEMPNIYCITSCLPSGIMTYLWGSQFRRAIKQVLLAFWLELSHWMAISVASKLFGTIL